MITTHLMGGLGNQLFQIFNLISYCLKYKISFYFENKNPERIDRPFYWDNFFKSLKPFVRDNYENIPIYKEQDFHYNELLPFNQINKNFKFFGYFQSYKYFNENYEQIIKFIRLHQQQEIIKKKYNDDYDFENIISIHFRIGDYKNHQQHHPLAKIEYYVNAIKYIIKTTEINDWNILYFYEEQDYEQVNENIKSIKMEIDNIEFIPINTKIVDYEQILLMSLCQHNIIANSSFSWWGAYFNQNLSKIVCHPDSNNWFGPSQGNKKMGDLLPNTWVNVLLSPYEDNPYKCVLSVGMRCFTEIFLKNMNLKKFSSPFDGMFHSSIYSVIYILKNKIEDINLIYTENIKNESIDILNKKHEYRTIHKKINYLENDLIKSYHNALLPHHNLNINETKKHFERCFERLEKIKLHKIKTLFCLFIHPKYGNDKDVILNDIKFLKNYLVDNYNCELLVCRFEKNNELYKWKMIINEDNLIYIHINNNSHFYDNNEIVLKEIFSKLKVDEKKLITYDELNLL